MRLKGHYFENMVQKTATFIKHFITTLFILLLLVIILMVGLVVCVYQNPSLQSYLAQQYAVPFLSQKLGTKVSVAGMYVDISKQIHLTDVLINDTKNDTLFFVHTLKANFDVFALIDKKIKIYGIDIEQPYFRMVKADNDTIFNLNYLLNNINKNTLVANKNKTELTAVATDSTDKTIAPFMFSMNLEYLHIKEPRFVLNDIAEQFNINAKLAQFNVDINAINIAQKTLDLEKVFLDKPVFSMYDSKLNAQKHVPNFEEIIHLNTLGWTINSTCFLIDMASVAIKTGKDTLYKKNIFNVNNLKINNLNVELSNVAIQNDSITTNIDKLTANEHCGFSIQLLKANLLFTPATIALNNLMLKTPNSLITNKIAFKFYTLTDFEDFLNRVKLAVELKLPTQLKLIDIAYFVPDLQKNNSISHLLNKTIYLSGTFRDKISKIRGDSMYIKIGNTHLAGNFRTKGLPDFMNTNIDFKITSLNSSMQELHSLLPTGTKMPKELDKLGNLSFTGYFTGFPKNFVAQGNLATDIGKVKSDINMNLLGNLPKYTGDLAVNNLNLGELLDKKEQFGTITFTSKVKGQGFKQKELIANVNANIAEFNFNKYTYRDVAINGVFDKKTFNGDLAINDPNLQLRNFKGNINFNDSIPKFDFAVDIAKIHLQNLNFLKRNNPNEDIIISLKTQLTLKGNNIDNIEGKASMVDVAIQKGKQNIAVKNIALEALFENNQRKVHLNSDLLEANFKGNFDFKQLPDAFMNYMNTYFPYRFKARKPTLPQQLEFNITLKNPLPVLQVFVPEFKELGSGVLKGEFNTNTKILSMTGKIPRIIVNNISIDSIFLDAFSDAKKIDFIANIKQVAIDKNFIIAQPTLQGKIFNDSILFNLKASNDNKIASTKANIEGLLFANTDTIKLQLYQTELTYNNQIWEAQSGIFAYKAPNYLLFDDVILSNGKQQIKAMLNQNDSLKTYALVTIDSLDVSMFSNIPFMQTVGMGGIVQHGQILVKDLLKQNKTNINDQLMIIADLKIDSFRFMNQLLGNTTGTVIKRSTDNKIVIKANVVDKDYDLNADGFVGLSEKKGEKETINLKLNGKKVALRFLEKFLGTYINDTKGHARGEVTLSGYADKPDWKGKLFIMNGETTVNILETRYKFDNQWVTMGSADGKNPGKLISFANFKLDDKDGNDASLNGNINLNDYKNLLINLNLNTPNFLLSNTKFKEGAPYYGPIYAGGTIDFKGPINNIAIYLNAQSKKGTVLYLPLTETSNVEKQQIFTFVDKYHKNKYLKTDSVVLNTPSIASSNNSISMFFNMDVTPDAELQIIFDANTGDIIKATGNGNIRMDVSTKGNYTTFSVFGDYTIENGKYRFNLQNLISKNFEIKKGSTLKFSGDPYQAILDVDAVYTRNISRAELFSEEEKLELTGNQLSDLEKRVPTSVHLLMNGILASPEINFKILFPEQGSSAVDELVKNRIEEITNNDINELSKQVFGMLVFNRFMPREQLNLDVRSGVNATVSELVSSYASNYLSDIVGKLIPGSEFSVDWSTYSDESNQSINSNKNELQLTYTQRLLNNRLAINVGGDVVENKEGGSTESGATFNTDFSVEYDITPDGKYKARAFNKYDNDVLSGRNLKTGIGFSYNWERDKKSKRKAKQKHKKEQEENQKKIENSK